MLHLPSSCRFQICPGIKQRIQTVWFVSDLPGTNTLHEYTSLKSVCLSISLCVQILALFIIQLERLRGCRSSVFLFLFWVLAVVCSLVPLRAKIQLALDEVRAVWNLRLHALHYSIPFYYVGVHVYYRYVSTR